MMETVKEAEKLLREVTERYGTPVYIAHIPGRVRRLVPLDTRREILADARVSEGWEGIVRDQGRDKIIKWAEENTYELVTVKQLAEIGGVSENVARELVKRNPRMFRKSEGWTYEVRNPNDDKKR
jgi:predicted transcriptional regulator